MQVTGGKGGVPSRERLTSKGVLRDPARGRGCGHKPYRVCYPVATMNRWFKMRATDEELARWAAQAAAAGLTLSAHVRRLLGGVPGTDRAPTPVEPGSTPGPPAKTALPTLKQLVAEKQERLAQAKKALEAREAVWDHVPIPLALTPKAEKAVASEWKPKRKACNRCGQVSTSPKDMHCSCGGRFKHPDDF